MEQGREGRRLLGRREVAVRFGVSPQTVTRWAQAGLLPFVLTMGGQRRYPEREVEMVVGRLWENTLSAFADSPARGRRQRGAKEPLEEASPEGRL